VPRHRLQTYLDRGDLACLRGSKCIYVDPGDLIVVSEIDWQNPPPELGQAALQTWRERLVKVLAGQNWRTGRPFRAQPLRRTDRRWGPRLTQPGPKPNELSAGDRVEVIAPVPGRPYCLGPPGSAAPRVLAGQSHRERFRQVHSRAAVDGPRGVHEPAPTEPGTAGDLHVATRVPAPVFVTQR